MRECERWPETHGRRPCRLRAVRQRPAFRPNALGSRRPSAGTMDIPWPLGYLNAPRAMRQSLMLLPERAPIVRRSYLRCRRENSTPDPDFRYFSNSTAKSSVRNSSTTLICQVGLGQCEPRHPCYGRSVVGERQKSGVCVWWDGRGFAGRKQSA